ncbi:MAG: sulfur carrier protein ThiS [Solirubrobacteraceae bacterium]|nr:sulfur carrier protein ThiS [Solirubrobacteraceae bacterium]
MSSAALTVNGAPRDDLPAPLSVAALVAAHGLPAEGRGVAVAVDGEIVPRGQWADHVIPVGAEVELVQAIQGG